MFNGKRTAAIPAGIMTLLFLTFLVTASYGNILTLNFTATDSLTLIYDSRILEWSDVGHILSDGIMGGEFYRPIAQFSYSLDYALGGVSPVGYHLTDLLLHMTSVLLVALFAYRWQPDYGWMGACLSALFFAVHPILLESVPAIARRHDVLATVFGLLSLIFYDAAWRGKRTPLMLLLSLLMTGLAIGSKEIGVIVPALVWIDLWFIKRHKNRQTFKKSINYTLLFAMLVAGLLYWRQTRGTMGVDIESVLQNGDALWQISQSYVAGLFLGQAVLGSGAVVFCLAYLIVGGIWARLYRRRLILLASAWLLLVWGLLLLTDRPDMRNLYLPAVGAGLLWSGLVIELTRVVYRFRKVKWLAAAVLLFLLIVLSGNLMRQSPLLIEYPGWEMASRMVTLLLNEADQMTALLPPGGDLYLLHVPSHLEPSSEGYQEQSVSIMRDHSLISWLALKYPERSAQIHVCDYRQLSVEPSLPALQSFFYGNTAVIVVTTKEDEVGLPWQYLWADVCDVAAPVGGTAVFPQLPPDVTPLDIRLGSAIKLAGAALPPPAVRTRQAVMLYWQVTEPIATSYTVFIHLLNEQGELVAQHDSVPVNGIYPTTEWLPGVFIADGYSILLPSDLPSGSYRLVVGMYDLETLQRLPITVYTGAPLADSAVEIGTLTMRYGR